MTKIKEIQNAISSLTNDLNNHELYRNLKNIDDIKIFMESHVYAVWDFMSLLKALQKNITCTTTPWLPSKNEEAARFINEIVLGEETDRNENGDIKSHFNMYLDAMEQLGASTREINKFTAELENGNDIFSSINNLNIEPNVKDFLNFTFELIEENKNHKIASAFTFGREDIIPDMFIEILKNADQENTKFNKLKYYLERHIELDGDEHGPLALKLISELCGNNDQKWEEVKETGIQAIKHRISLWNGINEKFYILA